MPTPAWGCDAPPKHYREGRRLHEVSWPAGIPSGEHRAAGENLSVTLSLLQRNQLHFQEHWQGRKVPAVGLPRSQVSAVTAGLIASIWSKINAVSKFDILKTLGIPGAIRSVTVCWWSYYIYWNIYVKYHFLILFTLHIKLFAPLFPLCPAEIACCPSGSPCLWNVRWSFRCMKTQQCSETLALSVVSSASLRRCTTSRSHWKPHWSKASSFSPTG